MTPTQNLFRKAIRSLKAAATILTTAIAISATVLALALPQQAAALSVEPIPLNGSAVHGYTHRITVKFSDLASNSTDCASIQLFPRTNTLAGTNWVIGGIAWTLTQPFTSSATLATNAVLFLGFGGTIITGLATNTFVNGIEIDSRARGLNQMGAMGPINMGVTNQSFMLSGSSNYLLMTFKTTNGINAYTNGQVDIFVRAINLLPQRKPVGAN
jgi:hypothetical protein